MEKIIIDTDPGIDDAVAIIFAMHSLQLEITLLTTVAGNVDVNKTTHNALQLVTEYQKAIPVAKGCAAPLLNQLQTAEKVHGDSGMDGYVFSKPTSTVVQDHAVQAMYHLLNNSPTPITLVPIGPLTNIALLLTLYQTIKPKIKRVVLMGGAINRGNVTPSAEFNFWADPIAAQIVLNSGLDITVVPLEIGQQALIHQTHVNRFATLNKTGKIFANIFQHYRGGSLQTGLKMYDPTVITYLEQPELFTTQKVFMAVETNQGYTFGHSIVDLNHKLNQPANITLCTNIDQQGFVRWFDQAIMRCP